MRENLVYIFQFLTSILGILLFISAFLFTSKGLVSRKTLLFSFLCFVLFAISLGTTAILTKPSITTTIVICVGGVIALVGIVFAVKYFTLPVYESHIKKKINEHNHKKED